MSQHYCFSLAQYSEKLCLSMTCEWEWDLVLVTDKIKIPGPRSAVGQWIRCFRWNTAKIEDLRQKNTCKIHQESSDHPDSTDSTPHYRSHKININQPLKNTHLTPQPIWGGMPSKGKVGAGSHPPLGHLLHLLGGPHHARTHRRPRRHRLRPPRPHPARPHRCRLRHLKSLASDDSWRACEGKANVILDVPGLYIQT